MKKSPAFTKLDSKITPEQMQILLDTESLYNVYSMLKVSEQLLLRYIQYYNLAFKKAFRTIHDLTELEKEQIISMWKNTTETKRDIAKRYSIGPKTLNRLFKENAVPDRMAAQKDIEWYNYRKFVHALTAVVKRHHKMPQPSGYDWDHRFSVYEGYRQNVSPYLIASKENLELILLSENRSNGRECSISLDELFATLKIQVSN